MKDEAKEEEFNIGDIISPQESPTMKKLVYDEPNMSFNEALEAIKNGKKVTKEEWDSEETYGHLQDEHLRLHKPDGKSYHWILSVGDLEGEDYYVIN